MRNSWHHVTRAEVVTIIIISDTFSSTIKHPSPHVLIIKMPCAQTPEYCLRDRIGSLGHWGLFYQPARPPQHWDSVLFSGVQKQKSCVEHFRMCCFEEDHWGFVQGAQHAFGTPSCIVFIHCIVRCSRTNAHAPKAHTRSDTHHSQDG